MMDEKISGLINDQLIRGGPIDGSTMESFKMQQQVQPIGESPGPMSSLIPSKNPPETFGITKSPVFKMLQKAGIDDNGVAFNELGKMNLMSRLKKKYGDGFAQNPEALDILNSFNKEMDKAPMESQKNLAAAFKSGERTLKALFGG